MRIRKSNGSKQIGAIGLATIALAAGVATSAPANAAQGAVDRSGASSNAHAWMKVSASELRGKTVDRACTDIFGNGWPGYRPCDNLVVMVVQQKLANPKANGYWAEWYFNTGKRRSGIW